MQVHPSIPSSLTMKEKKATNTLLKRKNNNCIMIQGEGILIEPHSSCESLFSHTLKLQNDQEEIPVISSSTPFNTVAIVQRREPNTNITSSTSRRMLFSSLKRRKRRMSFFSSLPLLNFSSSTATLTSAQLVILLLFLVMSSVFIPTSSLLSTSSFTSATNLSSSSRSNVDLSTSSSLASPIGRALTPSSSSSTTGSTRCSGHWRYPTGCRGQTCQYLCQWKYNYDRDQVDFTLSTNRPDKWVGVGFSKDLKMPGSDVVVAWVEPGSRYVMMDAWLDSYSLPIPDAKQSISNISAAAANGLISFFFSRPYKTGDLVNDINFEECFHFIFPVGGGSVDIKQRVVLKHDVTPTVTTQKFCFNACHAKAISSNTTASTTASPKLPSFVSSTVTTSIPVVTTITTTTTTTTTPAPSPPPPTTVTSENVNHETSSSSEGESTSNRQNSPTASFNDLDSIISDCKGEWKYPARCTGYGCDYKATWEYLDDDDDILFTLATKHRNKWTGIAFSNDKAMPQTDAIIGLVEDSGRFFLMDTWLRSYAAPSLDPVQNIQNMTVRRENGITSLRFTRKRKTGDKNDYQFSDTNCPYFLFPVNGGVFNAVNKRLRKHESVPLVSDGRICVKSCRPKPPTTVTTSTTTTSSTTSTTSTTTTTIRPPTTSTHSVIAKSTHLPPVPSSPQLPKININDFDFSQLGPSVVDLSKFNGKIPDLTQLGGNTTALNSLLESVNVSGANFPSILKNLAGKLPPNLKNDSTLVSLLNQHSSSTSSISSSFPTPKHTTSVSSSTNDSDSPLHKKKKGDERSETDSRTKAEGNESDSYPTPSSPTFSTTTKAPSRGITSKSTKIPSRWSTFRTSTSTSTTTTSTTPSPKKGNNGELGDNSDSTGGGEGGVDDGEDGEGDEEEIETPSPPSISDNNNNNDNLNNVSSNNNSNKSRKKPLLVHESKYVVELKLPKAWKASFVRRQSEEYQKFKEKIEHQVKKELAGQFSALEVKVMDLSSASSSSSSTSSSSTTKSSGGSPSGDEDDKTATIAKLKLSVMTSDDTSSPSSSNHPKGKTQEVRESSSTASSSSSSTAKTPVKLQEALNLAIRDGRVGDVAVDSTYLIIRSLGKITQKLHCINTFTFRFGLFFPLLYTEY